MKNNRTKGYKGEDLAAKFLQQKGYEIVAMNYYASRFGEIDIIAKDKDSLVFAEVKTRTTNDFGHPFESITPSKIKKMRKAVSYYIQENNPKNNDIRLDAIAITLKPEMNIEHLQNIY